MKPGPTNENYLHLWRRWEQIHLTILIVVPQEKITHFLLKLLHCYNLKDSRLCDWELCYHGDTFHFPKQEVISHRVMSLKTLFSLQWPLMRVSAGPTSLLEAKFYNKYRRL